MKFIFIFILIIGCAHDLDINPLATIMKHLITGKSYENGALPYHHSKQR